VINFDANIMTLNWIFCHNYMTVEKNKRLTFVIHKSSNNLFHG